MSIELFMMSFETIKELEITCYKEKIEGLSCFKIDLHFAGIFMRYPTICYSDCAEQRFDDVDFAGMDKNEFVVFIQRFANEVCFNVYFCMPDVEFPDGLRVIATDIDYMDFIEVGYASVVVIHVYMDHLGVNVHQWIHDEQAELCSSLDKLSARNEVGEEVQCGMDMDDGIDIEDLVDHSWQGVTEDLQGTREDLQDEEDDGIDIEVDNVQGDMEDLQGSREDWQGKEDDGIDLEVDSEPDECIPTNKTKDDEFLSKLCPKDQVIPNRPPHEEPYDHVDEDEVISNDQDIYNEKVHWKKQKFVLGMRFVSPKQLKHMLCNYVVANGYRLCYKRNDSGRLLVKCCYGACKFRLWASWMSEEKSFQIKSLINEHNYARNFKLDSIVNYTWIGTHYTTQFLQKQKASVRLLRGEFKEKFGIDVSMGQCRRAKKYVIELIEGTLVDHYAKLWSYGEEIRRSNPRSTVKIDVNAMPYGKTCFSKFYICFDGLKQGWRGSCRRVINLDECFLKGLCSGELICTVGRDANNHIFPIAWAVCLLKTVKEVLPIVKHRQCERHIVANFRKRFNGASKASTKPLFNVAMKEIQVLNPAVYDYLMETNPKSWSRAFFKKERCVMQWRMDYLRALTVSSGTQEKSQSSPC
uniref:Transposase MuDR plant domain-containing protein n=1 Tax=Lactuca sativa TaxID=4236 RepID=A0A9R1VDX1_LACSA|nr:hypothetical protein LSAT_V11C500238060 [Lactuca sativa]